jgi:hypothetical protein
MNYHSENSGYYLKNQLVELHLNDNALSGRIPSELSELSSLGQLSLHNNGLSGEVPSGVCANKDASLEFLSISVDCRRVDCNCGCQCPTD